LIPIFVTASGSSRPHASCRRYRSLNVGPGVGGTA